MACPHQHLLALAVALATMCDVTALQCYQCSTGYGQPCGDPFNPTAVSPSACSSDANSCAVFTGSVTENGQTNTGITLRWCYNNQFGSNACRQVSNFQANVPGHVVSVTGTACFCSTNNCNTSPASGAIKAGLPQSTSAMGLLALFAARLYA